MAETTIHSVPRPPGRPRSSRADEAIIDAVLGLLAEGGTVESLSMEAVATRAGVGKATVYRRWPHKDALLLHVLASLRGPMEEPPGHSVREDLVILLRRFWEGRGDRAGGIIPCLVPALRREGPLRTQILELVDCRLEVVRKVLRGGIANGQLRPDTDVELALILLSGPMFMALLGNAPNVEEEGLAERIVDGVLQGIAC